MERESACDVLVVGGGLGGVAAALSSLRLGRHVVVAEPTPWLGGQLTVQGVPPDEHPWIERGGATASYRTFRDAVRAYYRRHRPLNDRARRDPWLNPGQGWVSALCHEPAVAAEVLAAMLAPYRARGRLEILFEHHLGGVATEADDVVEVRLEGHDGTRSIVPRFVLDATDDGDVLPPAACEHSLGAESQADTGEPHARTEGSDPLDQQAITWCFALEHDPGQDHTIERPRSYDFWSSYRAPFWPGPQLGWETPDPESDRVLNRPLFAEDPTDQDLWTFRRVAYGGHYEDGAGYRDVSLVNWPQVDYWLAPVVGVPETERRANLAAAKELSLCWLYLLQHDAPRPDGGTGYPGLCLSGDILGTSDGFAMRPYTREGRRIKACFTVDETHVGVAAREPLQGAEEFPDSVGVGSYRIDLHPTTGGSGYLDLASWPFQIPLGSLVPVRMRNLLPAAKNLGVTHITNGCYRLHPVEWNVGESAGALAAFCLDTGLTPQQVLAREARIEDLQRILVRLGVQLSWPEDIRLSPR